MGLYIRKALSVGPFRFNLSKSGVGVSVGVKGLRIGTGPRGNYVHMGRGGLYLRQSLGSASRTTRTPSATPSVPPTQPSATVGPVAEIDSGSALEMTDGSHTELVRELNEKRRKGRLLPGVIALCGVFFLLLVGGHAPAWLLALSLPAFGVLYRITSTQDALRKTTVIFYNLEPDVERAYQNLHNAFDQLRSCGRAWHIQARGGVQDRRYHAGAASVVNRTPVALVTGQPSLVKTNIEVPMIPVGKQTLAFMPDHLLVFESAAVGAVSYSDLTTERVEARFIEEETVAQDATVVDRTWRYVNKDGGPDRRFRDNRELPVCVYEQLRFSSASGLNETIQLSRKGAGEPFCKALARMHEPAVADTVQPSIKAPEPSVTDGKGAGQIVTGQDTSTRRIGPDKAFPFLCEKGGPFVRPSVKLLDRPAGEPGGSSQEEMVENCRILEKKLLEFGVEGRVTGVNPGPVITSYELEPGPGIKLNRILALADDLILALKSPSVRLVAPIPGKAAVGVEIPNRHRATVYLREILATNEFGNEALQLPLALGKDIGGAPVVADLTQMRHLLIAGETGSGKSVFINALILSLLYRSQPRDVRFLLIDPKRVELSVYNGIPHLADRVVSDPRDAARRLQRVVTHMEERYKLFAQVGARNLQSYNRRMELTPQAADDLAQGSYRGALPMLVVVIDELADLILTAQSEVENAIMRLAQMAQAVGIHLIVATQRPSGDVLTGVIMAHFPARISFRVASKVDSRSILYMNGAEALLGKGDMLYIPPGSSKPIRIHGCNVTEEEIRRVVDFLSVQSDAPEFVWSLLPPEPNAPEEDEEEGDELYRQAVEMVVQTQQASISMIQCQLRVGFNRAARMIERMEREGIVSPMDRTRPREVLLSRAEPDSDAVVPPGPAASESNAAKPPETTPAFCKWLEEELEAIAAERGRPRVFGFLAEMETVLGIAANFAVIRTPTEGQCSRRRSGLLLSLFKLGRMEELKHFPRELDPTGLQRAPELFKKGLTKYLQPDLYQLLRARLAELISYDQERGTRLAERVKNVWLRVAEAVVKTEGDPTSEEEAHLRRVKEALGGKTEAKMDVVQDKSAGLPPEKALDFFRHKADYYITGVVGERLEAATRNVLYNALKTGQSTATTIQQLRAVFDPHPDNRNQLDPEQIESDASQILAYVRRTVASLAGPVAECFRRLPENERPDSTEELMGDIRCMAYWFAFEDGDLSDRAAGFLWELTRVFEPSLPSAATVTPGALRNYCRKCFQESASVYAKVVDELLPSLVSALLAYDAQHGTAEAEVARTLFYRVAKAVITMNGIGTADEADSLRQFRRALWAAPKPKPQPTEAPKSVPPQIAPVVPGKEPSLDALLAELRGLIGLARVKNDVEELMAFLTVQQRRKARGLPPVPVSLHLVFTGNPGTGKTTVARLIAHLYRALGILKQDHIVETDRAGLVGGYLGETALKTKEKIASALGGVLFIDEAYSLFDLGPGGGDQYGAEAIATLLKAMEDHREELVVILAGYPAKMERFIESNPGLRSRFSRYIYFDDYTPADLVAIFESFCTKSSYRLSDDARKRVAALFEKAYAARDEKFGNARLARNMFEKAIQNQAERIVNEVTPTQDVLSTIQIEDLVIELPEQGRGKMPAPSSEMEDPGYL